MATATMKKETLADILLRDGFISQEQYDKALEQYGFTKRSLVRILTEMGAIDENLRLKILRQSCSCDAVSLADFTPEYSVVGRMTRRQCHKYHVVPLRRDGDSVVVAMEDPTDIRLLGDLEKIFGSPVSPVLARSQEIADTIERLPELEDQTGVGPIIEPSVGWKVSSLVILPALVALPLAFFFYFVVGTDAGYSWYGGLGLGTFEEILFFVVGWGSWAAIAYFLHDLIFNQRKR